MDTDYGDYGDDRLSPRLFFRVLQDLHPDEELIRMSERQEFSMHAKACETPFSVRSYEFQAGGDGAMWRQWICWCGEGTYVERINK